MNVVDLYDKLFDFGPGSMVLLYGVIDPGYSNEHEGQILEVYRINKDKCLSYGNTDEPGTPSICKQCRNNYYPIHLIDPNDKYHTVSGCYYKMKKVDGADIKTIMERRG